MNIDDLTIGQAKAIVAQFGARSDRTQHHAVGRYCLVRSHMMGCMAGIVVSVSEPNADSTRNVELKDARRLWRWWAAIGTGLDSVAASGLADRREVRVGAVSPWQEVTGVGQIIEATETGRQSIESRESTQG
jgi:hypothetical protein